MKYYEYLSEIFSQEMFRGLLSCGLFANKLPDFLQGNEFFNYTKGINFPINEPPADYIRYSNMRNINIPRPLSIPNPFVYANLCHSIKDNWGNIVTHFEKMTKDDEYKISRIHLRRIASECGFFSMNYKNFKIDDSPEDELIIKSRYLVYADISKFFPSIYSHSIPWAILGKELAKKSRKPGEWFNKLDKSIRNSKYGETNGLLIGPHTSNLLSEIILTKVDSALVKLGFKFIRNVDDYKCYTKSIAESEKFLLSLSEELKEYELTLNDKKSKIETLPKGRVSSWVNSLGNYVFQNTYTIEDKSALRLKELKSFLDYSIELMLENNSDSAILNYAIKIISKYALGRNAKKYFIKQIHHLTLLKPYLVTLIDEFVFLPHNATKTEIKRISDDLYELGIEKKSYEACSYALFWALKYNFKLGHRRIKIESLQSNDCIFLLISYLYFRRFKTRNYLKEYEQRAKYFNSIDLNRYWLFVYEVLSESQLKGNYRKIKKAKVSFVKVAYS